MSVFRLHNHTLFEALPARLARAKRSAHARTLALSVWLLKRKHDGRFLAAVDVHGRLHALAPMGHAERLNLDAFAAQLQTRNAVAQATLPFAGLAQRLRSLGLSPDAYADRTGLSLVPEPGTLVFAGTDRYQRPLWLIRDAARAWQQMKTAARTDNIFLEAISGYRGHDYQLGIFERKLARGQTVEEILQVNAAPGYSEHHSGRAMDISSRGDVAAEESFENSEAFAWLVKHAGAFGFRLSYPRDNPHGIVYEPWHWYYVG